jgi:UDP-2-acetamido-2,6-beta-L-arabino-hexul-4-ose reductase
MLRIGITGQAGFIGTHLYNTLGLFPGKYIRVPCEDIFFQDISKLEAFVSHCDVIIHLAAMNRHDDPDVIYRTNIELVQQLIAAMEKNGARPHVLFSSSTQEMVDNSYGRSKQQGRKLFEEWAKRNGARFTGMIIPNVFGAFGKPYYNSVVSTFCHQLTHDETPKIDVDGELALIYISELVAIILERIIPDQSLNPACDSPITDSPSPIRAVHIPHTTVIKVSELLGKLQAFKEGYFNQGNIPDLTDRFDRDLFNTFACCIDHRSFFPFMLANKHADARGSFVEVLKSKSAGQVSFSTTLPGITRGNHFHTRKAERFAVIKGKARIELRRIGTQDVLSFRLDGDKPSFVDMPIWHTHNIANIGNDDLYTIFWTSEFFDPQDPDTFVERV